VILLRDPEEIIGAYERSGNGQVDETNVLLSELKAFYGGWSQKSKDNLIIRYRELISDPKKTINRIEKFWGIPKTEGPICLEKVRYSGRGECGRFLEDVTRKCKNLTSKFLIKLGAYEGVRKIYRKLLGKPGN
jgi:hypothetical protein